MQIEMATKKSLFSQGTTVGNDFQSFRSVIIIILNNRIIEKIEHSVS